MQNNTEIMDQIDAVRALLGLPAYAIEKDLYVTQAISIVTKVKHDNFDLVFQGGTALAKAHRVTHRMSEDCDFRIRKQVTSHLSKEGKRKLLRNFRRNLVHDLQLASFDIKKEEVRVRNEGQFMSIRAWYPSAFTPPEGLKPYLALEFFLGEVKTPSEFKPVTTLIQQVLGDKVQHPTVDVDSISITETAAEKWVALTRRVATMRHRNHYRDASLVRHIYDLYEIEKAGLFDDQFKELVPRIVVDDREQYRNHNDAYYLDPASEIKRALDELNDSSEWQRNWDEFVRDMVYDEQKPTYKEAMRVLRKISGMALSELDAVDFKVKNHQPEVKARSRKIAHSLDAE